MALWSENLITPISNLNSEVKNVGRYLHGSYTPPFVVLRWRDIIPTTFKFVYYISTTNTNKQKTGTHCRWQK
jgi:hypothetical protein